MSNIYIENNRIITTKEVDRYLKRIGSWHENFSRAEIIAVVIVLLAVAGCVFGLYYYKHYKNDKLIEIEQKLQDSAKTLSECMQMKFGRTI